VKSHIIFDLTIKFSYFSINRKTIHLVYGTVTLEQRIGEVLLLLQNDECLNGNNEKCIYPDESSEFEVIGAESEIGSQQRLTLLCMISGLGNSI
jgi:hypothetical protein